MTTDRSSYDEYGPAQTISDYDIDAYRSSKLDDGTWSAGLIWNFDLTDSGSANLTSAAFTAKIDGVSYYYFLGGRQAPVYPDGKPDTPTTPPAATATAVPTSSTVYVNGKAVKFESYTINGNNYFKLRDIGQLFDFGVEWDGSRNAIMIDTNKVYTSDK